MKEYTGILSTVKGRMTKEAARAYSSWRHQRERCYKKSFPKYKNYGGKGIQVLYSSREFIGWWLDNIKIKKNWVCPTTGRIDHNGDYCFDNIELQEKSDNTKEQVSRLGPVVSGIKVEMFCKETNKILKTFNTVQSAAEELGLGQTTIHKWVHGKVKNNKYSYSIRRRPDV